jgi:hypothetical protein
MKTKLLCSAIALLAGSLLAADTTPGDDITNAVNALAGAASYSWKSTVVVPEGSQYRPGPTTGKLEKDGYTDVSLTMRDNTIEFITKGDKVAVNTPDNGWQSPADLGTDQGPGRFIGGMIRNFKAPTAQALTLASAAQSLTNSDGVYSGDLTEAGAKTFLAMPRRGGGGGTPEISNAKGSVKFWISSGTLTKYEFKVTGTISFNGNDRDVDRDTTVEISDVGSTKVTVPDDALKIFSPAPAPAPAAAPATDATPK